jgi:hypothetical protein
MVSRLLRILDYDLTMFVPTAAQKLDTEVYNHTVGLLHVSALFTYLQGAI